LLAEFLEELPGWSALAREVFLVALSDMLADLRVLQFEVILELVDVHEPGHWDTILFEDDILLVEVDALDDRTEVDSGLCER
jgi:hypothetical protein